MQRDKTEIDASLLEALRKVAADQSRDESELLDEAVRHYLGKLRRVGHSGPRAEPSAEYLGADVHDPFVALLSRVGSRSNLGDEEAMELANEELHTFRKEQREPR